MSARECRSGQAIRTSPACQEQLGKPAIVGLTLRVSHYTSLTTPVLAPNDFASMPIWCSMRTKRLESSVLFFRSKARWPWCLKPPPARRIGRLLLSCEDELPRLLA